MTTPRLPVCMSAGIKSVELCFLEHHTCWQRQQFVLEIHCFRQFLLVWLCVCACVCVWGGGGRCFFLSKGIQSQSTIQMCGLLSILWCHDQTPKHARMSWFNIVKCIFKYSQGMVKNYEGIVRFCEVAATGCLVKYCESKVEYSWELVEYWEGLVG